MNNELYDKREEQLKKANDTYQQIVDEGNNLTSNQKGEIDSFISENTDRVNDSVNNNINDLSAANSRLEQNYQNELAGAENDYRNQVSLPIDETSRIIAYNSMKNRQDVATESRNQAYQEYLNQSKQAKLSGDATIAQLALQALKEKLDLSTNMVDYNSSLMKNKVANDRNIENAYWGLQQNYNSALNNQNELAENKRQFDETIKYQKAQDKIENDLAEKQYQLDLANAKKAQAKSYSSSRSSSSSSSSNNSVNLSNSSNLTNTKSGETKVYASSTPVGLSANASNFVENNLTSKVLSQGYITASYLQEQVANALNNKTITEQEAGVILSTFKEGTIKVNKQEQKEETKKKWTDYFKWW